MRRMIHKVLELLWIGVKVVKFIQAVGFEVVDIFPIVYSDRLPGGGSWATREVQMCWLSVKTTLEQESNKQIRRFSVG